MYNKECLCLQETVKTLLEEMIQMKTMLATVLVIVPPIIPATKTKEVEVEETAEVQILVAADTVSIKEMVAMLTTKEMVTSEKDYE